MLEQRISVVDLDTGRTRPLKEEKPLLSSASAGWKGFLLEEVRSIEIECNNVSGIYHVVWLNLDAPFVLNWEGDGRSVSQNIKPGQTGIGPANMPFSVHYRTEGSVIRVALEPNFLFSATAELGGWEPIVPLWRQGINDPLMRELILALRVEAQGGGRQGAVYAEALATTLAMHLARNY